MELDELIAAMEQSFGSRMEKIEDDVSKIKSDLSSFNQDLQNLKTATSRQSSSNFEAIQNQEQRSRNYSVKILNCPVNAITAGNPLHLAQYLHKELLSPMILLGKESGDIDLGPSALQTIEMCHLLPRRKRDENEDKPPTIQVRLTSRLLKQVIMMKKREFLTAYNKTNNTDIIILDDLSHSTLALMRRLRNTKEVTEVRFRRRVQFRVEGDSSWRVVNNITGRTLQEMETENPNPLMDD